MPLILNSKSWQDKDGFLTPITLGTLNGAFGEERILTLDYSFDQSLNDCEIYFNPALFVEQGINLNQTQTLPPNISYWYKVTVATVVGVENTMNLLNSNVTERNMSVAFELNTGRMSFKIHLTCFLTADILDFLNDNGIDNSIRLLGNTKNSDELENLEDSVYSSSDKGFGIHTGVKVPKVSQLCGTKGKAGAAGVQEDTYTADGELFVVRFNAQTLIDKLEIFVNGVLTASSGKNAGNNFGGVDGFDGNAGLGYALGAHPDPPVVPTPNNWYIGGATTFNNRLADFLADTGITATLGGYQQVIWVNTEIGDEIVIRVAGTNGTGWSYEIFCPQSSTTIPSRYDYDDAWINSEFLFLNEGTMTNPVFELSRNSIVETEFATFEDTDVTLQIDHTSAISNAKVWVIDADNTVQSLDFKKAYGYQPTNFFTAAVPSNIGGDTWETNFVIDKTKLNIAGRYFIIAVYYDAANEYVASYISDPIFVTDVKFLTPTIQGTIYTLIANFFTNYLEVSPLQRVCLEITLDKYTGFEAAYSGGNVQIGGETFTFLGKNNQGNFENTNRFVFSDSSGSLIIRFYLRVKEDWQNTEVDVLWNINFNVEYTTIAFPQRISVSQMEQNKAIPNLTEIKLYKDGITLIEDGDTACDANFLRVETIKDASAVNYAQAAIWKDENGNIYEEEAWNPISVFTQSSNAFQSNVEIQFSTVGSVNNVRHDITNLVDNGEVGMIGYPPPLPISFIRHPFHASTKTGRNVVFWAEYDYGAGKTLATVNGFPSSDFLFRVGTDTTPLNANDNAWAAFSDLSFAAFAALSIPAGSRIMVRYIGTQDPLTEQLNIVGYLEMRFSETPVNPKILQLPIERQIAAGDIMFFTGLNLNFTFLTYQTGSANVFTQKRTFTEVADNEDLVSYIAGLGSGSSPNNTFVPHLYFERSSTTAITPNITVDQIQLANVEIGNPAIPLYNFAYPITGNGTNPTAILNDRINYKFEVEDNGVKNAFDFNQIANGSYINVDFCVQASNTQGQRFLCLNSYIGTLDSEREFSFGIYLGGLFFNLTQYGGTRGFGFISPTNRVVVDNGIYKGSFSIQKIGNTLVPSTTIANPIGCLNGFAQTMLGVAIGGGSIEPMPTLNGRGTNSLEVGTYVNATPVNASAPSFASRKIQEVGFSISTTPLSKEEMEDYYLGNRGVESNQYAYRYDILNPNANPSFRQVPNIGTLADINNFVVVKFHSNLLTTLIN